MSKSWIEPWSRLPGGFWAWLAVAGVSACLIVGPYHMDEWGQITAFYLHHLDFMQDADMPWEFGERMRPWLQPLLYAGLLGPSISALGYDHFTVERVLHLLHWVLLVAIAPVYWRLVREAAGEGSAPRIGYWLIATVWFLPSMMVRHSSEVSSGLMLVLMVYAWKRSDRSANVRWAFGAGLLGCLAFWFRFQAALFVAPFWLTLLFSKRRDLRSLTAFAFAVVLLMPLGVVMDYVGYGEWVFSPYEYLRANVFEDAAAAFGESGPWFYFVIVVALFANPFVWFWFYEAARARWSDTWLRAIALGCLGFVLAHTAIGHKEARFMLPILPQLFLLVFAYLGLARVRCSWMRNPRLLRGIVALQIVALCLLTALGLTKDRVRIDLALSGLPEQQTVISGADLYGPALIDRFFPPYSIDNTGVDNYTRRFIRPQQVELVGAFADDYATACAEHDQAVVLFTSVDATRSSDELRESVLNYPWPNIASFPWPWFSLDARWYRKMWRFKLVPCDAVRSDWRKAVAFRVP